VKQPSGGERSLPAERAFVVQFHAETDGALGRFVGRVEHVISGQATHFQTLEEFLAFTARVLTSLRSRSPQGQ
jgi:hypothetical protein